MASTRDPRDLFQRAIDIQPKLKLLINTDLKTICKVEGLPVSGVKTVLQERIINHMVELARRGDASRLDTVIYRIAHNGNSPPRHYPSMPVAAYPDSASPVTAAALAHRPPPSHQGYAMPPRLRQPLYQPRFHFKESPFYEVLEVLAPTIELQRPTVLPSNRTSTQSSLILPQEVADRLKSDSSLRVMLYSAADPPLAPYARVDIAFPHQIEVKVNGEEVRSNFKGLKNKPGSTRPADITDLTRKIPGYKNIIQVTYALTQKKFQIVVNLVRKHSVEELTDRIRKGQVLSKERVLKDMASRADDEDIVVGSTVMSLKDPVSYVRISLPCRSAVCMHNQCFDAAFYLQLQEQAPTWLCPCCNKTISYESLVVDQYVQDILEKTSSSTEKVTIEPNGRWTPGDHTDTIAQAQNGLKNEASGDDDSEDDLVEISDYRVVNLKQEQSQTPLSGTHTPPVSSREPSAAATSGNNRGSKRKSEVIDLTLSDDDEPPRPAKRQAYNTPNSLPDSASRPHRPLALPYSNTAYSRPTAPVSPFRIPEHGANRPPNPLGPQINPRPRHSVDGNYRHQYHYTEYRSP